MIKKVTSTLLLLGTAVSTFGQSDFLGLPTSAYLNNISDSAAIQRGAPYVPMAAMGTYADDERFWQMKRLSLSYAYAKTSFDGESHGPCTHSGVAELYAESRLGQSLNLAGVYATTHEELPGAEADTDEFAFGAQAAQEFWRFLCPDDKSSRLWAGFGFGYGVMNTDFMLPGGVAEVDGDSFHITPNLIYVRGITDRLTAMVIPAYVMEWGNTDFGPVDFDAEASRFTLTGRADYGVTDRVILTGFGTFKRDIHMEIEGRPSNLDCHSWAEFGGGVRVAITEDIGLRAGYSYEAFHPDFDRHKFSALLELGF